MVKIVEVLLVVRVVKKVEVLLVVRMVKIVEVLLVVRVVKKVEVLLAVRVVRIVDVCPQAETLLHGLEPRYLFHVTVFGQLHMTKTTYSSIY